MKINQVLKIVNLRFPPKTLKKILLEYLLDSPNLKARYSIKASAIVTLCPKTN